MAETLRHSPDQSQFAPVFRNISGALAILLLAFAPQIFDFLWSVAGLIFRFGTRNPLDVLLDHLSALFLALRLIFLAVSVLPEYLYGLFSKGPSLVVAGINVAAASSPSILLASIYSYPLLVVAALTLFANIRGPQDYFGGIVLMAFALFALWASSDLQGMRGFSFGPGTAPRMFGFLLLALSAGVAVTGFLFEGPQLQRFGIRGPFFVTLAILSFSVTIRPLGLVVSAFVSFMIAAMGSEETEWKQTIIVGICLTAGCALLFPYALGLPLDLFPRILR